jgi:hypothetical protein
VLLTLPVSGHPAKSLNITLVAGGIGGGWYTPGQCHC